VKLEYSLIAVFVLVALWFVFLESFTLEATNMQLAGFMDIFFNWIKNLIEWIVKLFSDLLKGIF
jgi:hypothetical protein